MAVGGKRDGAGRGSLYGEKTKTVRLPKRIADVVQEVLQISYRVKSGQSIREDAEPAVWWLSQEDLEVIAGADESFELLARAEAPEYVCELCQDAMGRYGRGRLWADDGFRFRLSNPMPGTSRMTGLVLQKKDLAKVVLLPGMIQLDCHWEPRE